MADHYQLKAFSTPAKINDFPDDPAKFEQLSQIWSTNVDGFTQQAITGNPWNQEYSSEQTAYYDPLQTPIPMGSAALDVAWIAFPNRLAQYIGQNASPPNPYNLPQSKLFELADTGALQPYPIPANRCPQADWSGPKIAFGPYGPRGWLDEYCEWSVTRDENNKIVRVDFCCENPEYYQTLWRVDPDRCAQVYQETLNAGAPKNRQVLVTVEDLTLFDPNTGLAVIDPTTGRPAYNPLNRWNNGTKSVRTGDPSTFTGGAMHLTATPNTLQTELGLAGGSSVQRKPTVVNAKDPQALICCGMYGQNYRHSDPHIGQSVNLAVGAGPYNISLADPPGLYIQMPSFSTYELPDDPKLPKGAKADDCWQIVRGNASMIDPVTNEPFTGSFILHAAFQIPQAWIEAGVSFTVGDIKISGAPIQWGSQIANTFEIALFGRPIPPVFPTPQLPCVNTSPDTVQAQPLQLMYEILWDAYYETGVSNPVGYPMVLASNSAIIPPGVPAGSTVRIAMPFIAADSERPKVIFTNGNTPDPDIAVTVVGYNANIYYATPGNSYPSQSQLLRLEVTVAAGAAAGVRGVIIVSSGQNASQITPFPAALLVTAKGGQS